MPQDSNPLEERIDRLTKAIGILDDKITGLEKRQTKIEKLVMPIGFMPLQRDEPPKPPPSYFAAETAKTAEVKTANYSSGAGKDRGDEMPKREEESMESEIGTKWLGRIGIFALILGVSFFLKYAFDNDWIGETGRVVMGIIAGLALVCLGEYFRQKYINYAQTLTGGGIAILYLSIYAAFSYYTLIDQGTAFIMMGVITFAAGFLAVHYEKVGLAVLAILGGFMTPVLLSTGVNNQLGLFIYITLLNLGILGISFFRNWRKLNLLGFISSMLLFFGWYAAHYTSSQLFLTENFLTVTFVIYAIATASHNLIVKKKADEIDAALITLNAVFYFVWSYSILNQQYPEFMGFFAVLMALAYFIFAAISFRLNPEDRYLALFLPGLSILFLTLAIPIQLDGNWVTIGWFIEAVVLVGVSFSLASQEMRYFAWTIFILAFARLIFMDTEIQNLNSYTIIFNKRFLTFIVGINAISALYYLYSGQEKLARSKEGGAKPASLFLANFLLLLILSMEALTFYDQKINAIKLPAYPDCRTNYYNSNREEYYPNSYCDDKYAQYRQSINDRNKEVTSIRNSQNVVLSVLWLVYAIILLAFGFLNKNRQLRMMGMGLFGITILKLFFFDLWYLGTLYRIISSMSLGVVLLVASYAYTKYKDKIKEII